MGQRLEGLERLVRAQAQAVPSLWGSGRRKDLIALADQLGLLAQQARQAGAELRAEMEALEARVAAVEERLELERAVAADRDDRLELSVARLLESLEKDRPASPAGSYHSEPVGAAIAALPPGIGAAILALKLPPGALAAVGEEDADLTGELRRQGRELVWLGLGDLAAGGRSFAGILIGPADAYSPALIADAARSAPGNLEEKGLLLITGFYPDRLQGIARGGPWRHRPEDLLTLLKREGFDQPRLEELGVQSALPSVTLEPALDPLARAALEALTLELRGLSQRIHGPGAYLLSARVGPARAAASIRLGAAAG